MKKRQFIVTVYPFGFDELNKFYALTFYQTTIYDAFEVLSHYHNEGYLCTLKQKIVEVA